MIRNFDEIITLAQDHQPIRVAVAAAEDPSVLKGIEMAKERGLIEPIFVGDKEKISEIIKAEGFNLMAGDDIVHVADEKQACFKAIEIALAGKAEAVMKGKIDSGTFMSSALNRKMGLRGNRLVSCVALLEDPQANRILYLTDPVLNLYPDLLEKAALIRNAVEFAKVMGIPKPKVAVISAVELINPNMPSTIDAACLGKMAERGQISDAIVDGPFALDTLFSYQAALRKKIEGPLAGDVDILLAPNIETANAIFKMWTHFTGYNAIGVSIGLKVQLIHLPRESPPEAKLIGIAATVLMLRNKRS
ncbi:putative phosphate butyryltransferase [delta proteobacterium NaphS2]|nr:putative phosphate butyryltransferase [delta proteobacterium NaphS2]